MNLYGNDMDESTHPFESALGWTVALEPPGREFIGRAALEKIRAAGAGARAGGAPARGPRRAARPPEGAGGRGGGR